VLVVTRDRPVSYFWNRYRYSIC